MKGIWVLFQMRYGSLICSKEWLSDRPKWRGMLADPGATQPKQEAKQQKTTVLEWCENKGLPQLSDCHLAVCWSWGGYYTSSERGHPRLSADIWILTFDQLIGILWPYFGVWLGSANHPLHFGLSLCNLLLRIRLPYGIWKGTSLAFIWGIED